MKSFAFVLLLICTSSNAQPYKLFGGYRQDVPIEMKIFDDKLVLVGGGLMLTAPNVSDAFILTVTLDLDSILFTYHTDTSDTEFYYSIDKINNQFYTCGSFANYIDSPSYNVAPLVRLNNDYSIDTVFRYGGYYQDVFYKMIPLENSLYLFGITHSYTTESPGESSVDPYVVKCDAQGNAIWEKHPGTIRFDNLIDVCLDVSQQYFLCAGGTATQSGADPYYDGYLIKLDTSGNAVWRKTYKTGFQRTEYLTSITALPDGGGIAAGYVYDINTDAEAPYLIRFDSNGDTVWTKVPYRFDELNYSSYKRPWRDSEIWDVLLLSNGDFVFTGDYYNTDSSTRDIFICKYSVQGDSIWRINLGDAWADRGRCLVEDSEGFIYAAGAYVNPNTTNGLKDVLIIKLDANGCTVDTCLVTAIHQPIFSNFDAISVYPNPFTNELQLSVSGLSSSAQLEITNVLGQRIRQTIIEQQNHNIHQSFDLSLLPPGVYIVTLRSNNSVYTRKVVKAD